MTPITRYTVRSPPISSSLLICTPDIYFLYTLDNTHPLLRVYPNFVSYNIQNTPLVVFEQQRKNNYIKKSDTIAAPQHNLKETICILNLKSNTKMH